MADTEHPQTDDQSAERLARDVARLYSFAHAEDVPYRVFTRAQKARPTMHPVAEVSVPEAPAETPAESAAVVPAPAAPIAAPDPPLQAEPAVVEPVAPPAVHVSVPPVAPIPTKPKAVNRPAIAIMSIAGGVGKTTIAANLGRVLSARNEHVLLVDATWSSLLPYYFGAEDMRRGMRVFHSPESNTPPIRILGAENITHEWLEKEVKPAMQNSQRTIFDIGPASLGLLPEILPLCSMFLIPLVVDINSIMSIPRVEAFSRSVHERQPDLPEPLYILNKLDEQSEREQQGRELIQRQIGDRLLPISLRRSAAVTEAISGRMTVVDYESESEIANDFTELALWVQKALPVTQHATHSGRWSEA